MKVLIHVHYDRKTNNLKRFKNNAKIWLSYHPNSNRIMFSHSLKLYSKNFDCTLTGLNKLISTVKKMNQGAVKIETI